MSQTTEQPAPATEPADTSAPGTETPATEATTEGEGEPKPEPEAKAKPEREPWFVKRIAELTREKADRDRVLQQAQTELQRARIAQPADPNAPADVNTLAERRAQQMVAEQTFNADCNKTYEAGKAAFPTFDADMATLNSIGVSRGLIEAALEAGNAHQALHALAADPDEAMRIMGLSPARMGAALAKLAASPAKPVPVTGAPAPVRSINGGGGKGNDDPDKMNMAEFSAWRAKTAKLH
jgi:hypothetical protein